MIGVMGSAGALPSGLSQGKIDALISRLGRALVESNCILVTGETSGIPGKLIHAVRTLGGLSIGISPAHNEAEQRAQYQTPDISSDAVIYTGFGYKGRNVINIRASDIVIIFGGSIGTLNEFTIAYDEGKIIGVLTGTGGSADLISSIVKTLGKKTPAEVCYDSEPESLLTSCLQAFEARLRKATSSNNS